MLKKTLLGAVILMGLVSGLSADIYNTQCMPGQNKIFYNHNGFFTYAWVYVNNEPRGDFKSISSGSGSYETNLNIGDMVIVYYYSGYEYGHDIAHCY